MTNTNVSIRASYVNVLLKRILQLYKTLTTFLKMLENAFELPYNNNSNNQVRINITCFEHAQFSRKY